MLTTEEKSRAFDLILTGQATGMSEFWRSIRDLKTEDQSVVLAKMGQLAAIEAIQLIKEEQQ
jgi:hypothetical protein